MMTLQDCASDGQRELCEMLARFFNDAEVKGSRIVCQAGCDNRRVDRQDCQKTWTGFVSTNATTGRNNSTVCGMNSAPGGCRSVKYNKLK